MRRSIQLGLAGGIAALALEAIVWALSGGLGPLGVLTFGGGIVVGYEAALRDRAKAGG